MHNNFRLVIWYKTEESKTLSDLSDLGVWIKLIVGTDRRHVLRTFNEMSHEITYAGPLNALKIFSS